MNLSFEKIKELIQGVVYTDEFDGMLCLHRFTKAQEEAYTPYNMDFYKKTFATAGVRMEFLTDSTSLSMSGEAVPGSSRYFFSFDIYANGALVKTARFNITDDKALFSFDTELGEGEKKVVIYFPWSVAARISSFSLDDGAFADPIARPYKMISFGDSITHGYDAKNPSFSYVSRLADALQADVINKGIGGEVFFPALAEFNDDIEPDYITVAYGTNDWSQCKDTQGKDRFDTRCKEFYTLLSAKYPRTKIFAVTPIWRGDWERDTQVVPFAYIREYISEVTSILPNVTVIDGFDLVPHEKTCFVRDLLHPNDEGFRHYASNLYAKIKKYL